MESLLRYAFAFVGTPYKYGGESPMEGLDCSGFVKEILIAAGVLPHGVDLTAQGIYETLISRARTGVWEPGAIAFYGKSLDRITHVAFCVDSDTMLEAGGGDAQTTTMVESIKHRAFIRMRPIRYRRDFLLVIRPDYDRAFSA